jgi:outer membrane autotransporter protein
VTCTFNSGNSAQLASETVNSFLNRRNNLILSNGPTRARRMSRLNQGIGTSETLSFQTGDLKSMSPVNFNLLSIGSGNYSLSTSLSQVERAGTMFALAHDGDDDYTTTLKNRRFDVWFEAHYSKFSASQGSGGHFGIAYFGADYLITNDVLAGFMLQFDSLEDITPTTSVDGTGWMAGPYVTARLAPNLIFDGRLAYGQSNNDLRTNLSSGNFDTDRWLVDVNLSGNFDYKDWVISPNLNISYIEDRQHAFTDSLSVVVPEQTVSLGQIKFGPTFSTSYVTTNKMTVQPSFTLNGIYNFGNRSGPLITNNTADETNGFRGRVEAAVKLTNRHGTQVDLGMNYDGIGKSDFESWGLKFGLRIPLQ